MAFNFGCKHKYYGNGSLGLIVPTSPIFIYVVKPSDLPVLF